MVAHRDDVARGGAQSAAHFVGEHDCGRLLHERQQAAKTDQTLASLGDQLAALAHAFEHAAEIALPQAPATGSTREYFGRYRVDERERTVTYDVQQSLFPNWIGSKQVRYYTIADRKLTLRTPPFQYLGKSVTAVLLWDKIR